MWRARPPARHHPAEMRRFLVYGIWVLFFLALIGGGILAWRTLRGGEEALVGTAVTVRCNEICADRGQCGEIKQSAGPPVIMAGSIFPVVEAGRHDLLIEDGTAAEIRETMLVTLTVDGGPPFEQSFSRIEYRNPLNDALTGWVPDWCIE